MVEDNTPDKWGLRNLIPVLVVEVQKVCNIVITHTCTGSRGSEGLQYCYHSYLYW